VHNVTHGNALDHPLDEKRLEAFFSSNEELSSV
jgi:hypothetical protein